MVSFPNWDSVRENAPAIPNPKMLGSMAVLSTSFFLLQNLAQRLAGRVGLYAGRMAPLTTCLGFAATSLNMGMSNYASLKFEQSWDKEIDHVLFRPGVSMQDVVRRSTLGVAAYIALEGGMFRTVFPSSSISLGAYANTRSTMRSSIISNSAIASEAQRKRIQEMGRRFGCHQCGNRQLLSRKTFIADHMPPTKRAEELSAVWWRKILKIKVAQRLWPQCQNCYSVQGAAVRTWSHLPIYHSAFKLHHLAPLVALALDQNEAVRKSANDIVTPIVRIANQAEREIKRILKGK